MSRKYAYILPFATLLAACGPSVGSETDGSVGDDDGSVPWDGAPTADGPQVEQPDGAPVIDGGNVYGDADPIWGDGGCGATMCADPVDDGCTGSEVCGNGADDNCNGEVDDDCSCTPGSVQPCFLGPPGRRNVGSCEDGTQVCQGSGEFTHWGPCTGGIWPTGEACDTQDNNCNGCADDHPDCCTVELACPGPGDLPEGSPFTDYVINGTMFYSGPASSWSWTVVGGPCDQLLDATSGSVSYTLTGTTTSTVTFRPTLSGDYTFTMTVTAPDGTVYTCTFIVHVRGPGLRVELCWDTTGDTDIDLHVHKPGTTTPWFTTTAGGSDINSDDCYYYNCKADSFVCPLPPAFCGGWTPPAYAAEWGYANSPVAECSGSPSGPEWTMAGYCHNPRLDVDNITTAGIPENINVDNPANGQTFRVMVHFYGPNGSGPTTHPMVNVYCGGTLLGTYGAAPDLVTGFNAGGGFGEGPMWRVVDAQTVVDGSGTTTGCNLTPLHPPGTSDGYWVTNDDRSY